MKNNNREGGFIKKIVLFLILIGLLFFGYNAYKNIAKNPISTSTITEGVNQTIEEKKQELTETTDQIIEDSKRSIADKFKEKIGEIIDDIFRVKREPTTNETQDNQETIK